VLETVHMLIHALNDLTPLGLCGGLAFIIYLAVSKNGPVRKLSDNHLSDLPKIAKSLEKLVDSSSRQETDLSLIRDGINELKGRLHA